MGIIVGFAVTQKAQPYSPKAATREAVSSGVGCKRCGCRPRAPLDDHCAPCRQKVDEGKD